MKAVVQRVTEAEVTVSGEVVGSIGHGMLVLLGVAVGDTEADTIALAAKLCVLRIFEDDNGKMNRSLQDTGGSALVVSQFTLLGDTQRGRRPSFVGAAPPAEGERLYEKFVQSVRSHGVQVETGRFGAHMQVQLVNDGPVTLILDTRR